MEVEEHSRVLVEGPCRSPSSRPQVSQGNLSCRLNCKRGFASSAPCPTYLVRGSHAIGKGLPGELWFHSEAQQKATQQWPLVGHSHTSSPYEWGQHALHADLPFFSLIRLIQSYHRMLNQVVGPVYPLGHVKALVVHGGDLYIVSIMQLKSLIPVRIIGLDVGESLCTSTRRPISPKHIG